MVLTLPETLASASLSPKSALCLYGRSSSGNLVNLLCERDYDLYEIHVPTEYDRLVSPDSPSESAHSQVSSSKESTPCTDHDLETSLAAQQLAAWTQIRHNASAFSPAVSSTMASCSSFSSPVTSPQAQDKKLGLSERKRYPCDYPSCGKTFTTSGHLSRHKRIHTGEKPYPCPFPDCQARFRRQDGMNQHYRTHLLKIQNLPLPNPRVGTAVIRHLESVGKSSARRSARR
ncbi:uncharacterized protein BJ171DRAFT_489872 [Polychytrium aggregatum]|uniref:uncharacterized protein n=1 Tax=Polychytrium aggregatum TaxID=110093 RepID=UPI0022FEE4B0|nr:uncharacterized protein BJ171DRAFT_489872 [Polychytrium aggregatum]KAI9208752.1 hypothetical protein BJ171DRAFT_489872 [Polychytrium aggregatum]